MIRQPPRATRTDTLFPYTTLFRSPVLRANLAFHCACPIVQAREDAEFSVLTAAELADLAGFNAGSDRAPDISCTLLVPLGRLEDGPATSWRGPDILDKISMPLPVTADIWMPRKPPALPKGQ